MSNAELILVGTFLLVALLVAAPYYFFVVRSEVATEDMLRQRIRTGGGATIQKSSFTLLKEVERLSSIGPLNRALGSDSALARNLLEVIRISGLKVTPGQLVMGSACLVMVGVFLIDQLLHQFWLAVGGGLLLGALPYGVLRFIRSRRLNKFEEQFPEAIDLIARTLRAGHAFTTGLRMAADELPEPVAGEFKLLYDQQNYGLPLPDGLRAFAHRIPIIDARFFVTAVLTQREAGGNLAEVLDNLSAVIRERFKIKRQLRVISAHGRITGLVLTLLPPALAVYLMIQTPEHFRILIDDPAGNHMIELAVALQILGAFLIYKISKVEY
jgi:tight adherence protein B